MKPIIAANWKMHKTRNEASGFCRSLLEDGHLFSNKDVLLCPPFTALEIVSENIGGSEIKLGAQNMHWETSGAFTGEISAPMLLELGVEYVIIGHSERRHLMGETDEQINKKLKTALKHELKPILCVGETEAEYEKGATETVIKDQLSKAMEGIADLKINELIIAYEPVWAIGTGKAALPEDAEKAALLIHDMVRVLLGNEAASLLRVQYGGSVKSENIGSFMALSSVQGALVGGASLEADSFSALI